MSRTKLRAPANFGGLSLAGRAVDVGDDGSYHADDRDVPTLRGHGFQDWHDHPGEGGDVDTMTREQLLTAIVAKTRAEASKRSDDELRSGLRQVREMTGGERVRAEHEGPAPGPVDVMTEDRINAMPRAELFAYLKAQGAVAPSAAKDETLRAAALDTFRKQAA